MDNVVMGGMCCQNNIMDILCVDGNINIQCVFCCMNGRDCVSCCINVVNMLYNYLCIVWIVVFYDFFYIVLYGVGCLCFGYDVVFNFVVNV